MCINIKDTLMKYDDSRKCVTFKREKDKQHEIYFADCAQNFSGCYDTTSRKCIGTRNVIQLTMTLYSVPRIKIIFTKSLLSYLKTGKRAVQRFRCFQNVISHCGYTTYDLS